MSAPAGVAELLAAHDADLRGASEFAGADSVVRMGPLWLGRSGSRGMVSYRTLDGVNDLGGLIRQSIVYYQADPFVESFEWKTRGHDRRDDLAERLAEAGLVADPAETVMIGEARLLAIGERPDGITVRLAHDDADVVGVTRVHGEAFGPQPAHRAEQLRRIIADDDPHHQLWIAVDGQRVVSAGRLEVVPGTRFAGLFGGATLAEYRHRGIYRALTAARAAAAIHQGAGLVYAECTPFSRPIMEASGLVAVTTTTPWLWHRGG